MNYGAEQLVVPMKALADPVRLRIVVLCAQGECSVSELTRVLGLSQPRVSQHLKQLCDAGLLERFRDGHFVYYRVLSGGRQAALRRKLLGLVPMDDPGFAEDTARLRALRGTGNARADEQGTRNRSLHRSLVELTVAAPVGDLVDIGCGHGRILKLLASRARRAVGVDIDSDARRFARAELLLAGLPNCTLRQGDMYRLPLGDSEFDTAILDDVLFDAERPRDAIAEAVRILRPGGRLLLLATTGQQQFGEHAERLANWCADSDLRLSRARPIPARQPEWLLAVATKNDAATAAA
ncbi:MAG TPA: metalloregulator ArsR/SmtB family transcription factor [Woeseiaceae bacterium]|nr:metalloregulator ArsR/SmtB family transcription factor [Woeseiaceae bacterium]